MKPVLKGPNQRWGIGPRKFRVTNRPPVYVCRGVFATNHVLLFELFLLLDIQLREYRHGTEYFQEQLRHKQAFMETYGFQDRGTSLI